MNRAQMVRVGVRLRWLRPIACRGNPMRERNQRTGCRCRKGTMNRAPTIAKKIGEERYGGEEWGAGFGFACDWEYAGSAFEEDCDGWNGGGAGEAGVL